MPVKTEEITPDELITAGSRVVVVFPTDCLIEYVGEAGTVVEVTPDSEYRYAVLFDKESALLHSIDGVPDSYHRGWFCNSGTLRLIDEAPEAPAFSVSELF